MPFIFSFRHMDTSEALETYTEEKLKQTVARYGGQPERMEVIFDAENPQRMICSISISNKSERYRADDTGNYMYDCVDRAINKIDALMRKTHSKSKPRHESLRIVDEQEEVEDEDLSAIQ